ncbi:tetraprenyl-beta-curcumene synthase family protein [Halobacillus shinanisalinarum]|uniref:Tetraprenyl-beta-curcumene synthase family protein n=1 Tax=Halobacillus shinanisalinarum TaxID=2932258 RepID=A0ABY4H1H0_9BACI|nr:tetraprenyl-beta-curcumene synthase family protein [Halobacillus shinanisalinarum]UOQ94194.1 tetraprenyl-beta-curcumene synthase family protein [Halobacillus shinanisalinarum]
MARQVPTNALHLMIRVYKDIFPGVHSELNHWINKAKAIPNSELKNQALASIESKTFHCEGGSIYALLAGERWKESIRFIVAYQTISDYLDNLCDRSTSMDPSDFRMLHQAMIDALTPENNIKDYYYYREDKNDGGYLVELVQTCQSVLREAEGYAGVYQYTHKLGGLYSDLQVHKHVIEEERIPRLKSWFKDYQRSWPNLEWFEFSACSGSTLGIFCLISYTLSGQMTDQLAQQIGESYFPFMQGLHILLDYYIDQQEDEEEGDLNFCSYYDHGDQMKQRFVFFVKQTNQEVQKLPDTIFHQMIHEGLVGMYLADRKVSNIQHAKDFVKELLKVSGKKATFFYFNTKIYHKLKPGKPL